MSIKHDPCTNTYTAHPPHSHRSLGPKARTDTGVYRKRSFATAQEAHDYVEACTDNEWMSGVNESKKGFSVDVRNIYNSYTPPSPCEYFLLSDFGGSRDEALAAAKARRREVLTAKANRQPTPMYEDSVQNTPVWERRYSLQNMPSGISVRWHRGKWQFRVKDHTRRTKSHQFANKLFPIYDDSEKEAVFNEALAFWRKSQRAAAAGVSLEQLDERDPDSDDDIAALENIQDSDNEDCYK